MIACGFHWKFMRAVLSVVLILVMLVPLLLLGICVIPAIGHDIGRGAWDEAMSGLLVGGILVLVIAPLA
jgi:hypothetical protein